MASTPHPPAPQRMTTGFAFSCIHRAISEGLALRRFGKPEMKQVLEFFGDNACVFCGTRPFDRWDHLVAVRIGGDTVLGNMVPACSRCDSSKQDRPFGTWMYGESRDSPVSRGVADVDWRHQRLHEYMKRFGYMGLDPTARSPRAEFEKLESRINELRSEIELFIEKHRPR